MMWLSVLTLLLGTTLQFCSVSAESKGRYLIVSPRSFRNGSTNTISVTFFELDQQVRLTITVSVGYRKKAKTVASTSVTVETWDAGKMNAVELKIPSDAQIGTGKLVVKAVTKNGREYMSGQKGIAITRDATKLYIQSDKAIYKPGEKIRFRVVAVKPDLKPGDGQLTEVYIKNPSGTRMVQWKNVSLDTGFATLAMKLAKKPLLGTWIIKAKYDGKTVNKMITVEKYVLPKVEVSIQAPKSLLYKRPNFEVTVCAKYTYGKPAKGKATATFCLTRRSRYWRRRNNFPCVQIVKKVSGCSDFQILYPELADLRYAYGFQVKINVSFVETATNLKFKGEHNITKIDYWDTKLDFAGTPKYFKPGFPIVGQLRVTHSDDRPIAGSRKIKITARSANGILFEEYKKVKNGLLKFDIKPDSSMEYIRLQAEYVADHRKNVSPYYRTRRTSLFINSWYSRSKNYIVLERQKSPFMVGSSATVYVKGTGDDIPLNKVSYMLFCRGLQTLTGVYQVIFTREKKFQGKITFPTTYSMVPKCRLLTYYVRKDGEFIADHIVINFEETFENQVSVKFSESQRKPAQKVELEVRAYPGSRFALSAIDKSVQLLAKNNDLKSKDIMSILENQDVGPGGYYNYYRRPSRCPSPWYRHAYHRGRRSSPIFPSYRNSFVDGTQALRDSGVIYFSNLDIDVKPCPKRQYPIPYMTAVAEGARADGGVRRMKMGVNKASARPGPPPGRPMPSKPPTPKAKKEEKEDVHIRAEFPETWLWTEDFVNPKTGNKTIMATVPDTLTTWYANAFATSKTAGIGVAKTSSLLVFQPFFVSLALPYSVIRGEKVDIPATVFNYMDGCLSIKLSLASSDDAYETVSDADLNICACSDDAVTTRFKIVPRKLGKIPINVKAISVSTNFCKDKKTTNLVAADAISKKLLVEAEGIKKESTFNTYFCLKDDKDTHKQVIRLGLPPRYVPGSVYATLSVFGDLMGPSLTNLDGLLAMPYGCGEQNMLKFAPNIYILDYLSKTGQLTPNVKSRAIEYMLAGYQRELTYRRTDGSYSAFGNNDKEGSTWLTAFVLRSYGEARRYIDIDEKDILVSRNWLLRQQKSDGCFKEVGMVHHRDMKGGVKSGVTMTAFVLLSLLETGLQKTDRNVASALQCITKDLSSVDDSYTAAILSYTLTLAGSAEQSVILSVLKKLAKSADGMLHWESAPDTERRPWYMYGRARSADIEMTAYALMAYLKTMKYIEAIPVVRWLAKQRNSLGGFASTQDTCVALQALSKNARKTTSKGQDLTVNVKAPEIQHTFKMNEGNKLLLQRIELPKIPGNVDLEASGVGCALVQTNVKFNEEKEKMKPSFTLEVTVSPVGVFACRHQMKICARYNKGTSNMALIDAQMVSGFEPVTEDLDMILQSTENTLLKDYEFAGNLLSLYFNEIGESKVCVSFAVEEKQRVEDRKPAPIKVYDYYDTSKSATIMHNVQKCQMN